MKGIALLFIGCLAALSLPGQNKPRNVKQEISWMKNALLQHHVEPKAIDDSFSTDLFDKLLDDLDPDKIYFTSADVTSIGSFRTLLDDEINGKDMGFLNRLKDQYRSGLVRADKSITDLLASPLDWRVSETYQPEAERCATEEDLLNRHRQWLKFQILDRMADLKERDSVALPANFFKDHISSATAHVQFTTLRPIKRLLSDPRIVDHEVSNAFLQGMAGIFDPHSTFFSTTDYDNFVGSLSTEDYFFGFMLDEDGKGNVVISALAPGGAAWKSGALHVSDVLLALKWQNEEKIDLTGMSIEDVNEILSANESTLLEMTIRSVDGGEKQVTLRKEKASSDQNVVQSFILRGDIKVGYIYLPDFYTRWDDEQEGGRCANDVAKEIIRLKREGIDGIILDLRFNGGGSLFEARAMAGIFIDEGPLAMVTTRDKKSVTLKDMNRGTVYDGPLVLMVNGQSASASEVLAACIQDYNRGLIVGSATYGKATGQNIFPIESMTLEVPKKGQPGAGYVKITTQRLFRVTGKSAQGRGIMPDVLMPDIFSALNISERRYPFALKRDSIPVNPYFRPLTPLKRKELQALSSERLAKNPAFEELRKTISWLEQEMNRASKTEPLDPEKYFAIVQKQEEQQASADAVKSPDKIYEVSNGQTKEQQLAVDEYARELNDRWLDLLASDLYLQETYQVLRDLVSFTKKP